MRSHALKLAGLGLAFGFVAMREPLWRRMPVAGAKADLDKYTAIPTFTPAGDALRRQGLHGR